MSVLEAWLLPPGYQGGGAGYLLTALVALMLTAVSKGGFGGGVGMLSVPLMLQVAPSAPFLVGMWLPVLIACDVATIHHYPKEWNPRAFFKLAPGVLLGIALTTYFLSGIDLKTPPAEMKAPEGWMKLGIGAIAVVFVGLQYYAKGKPEDAEAWQPGWFAAIPIGAVAGVTTMVAHAAGTIITMFFLPMKMDKRVFVGTTGRFFFTFNTLKIPFYVLIGWIGWETFRYGIWLMLLGPLGVWFGSWLNHKVSAAGFVKLIHLFLVLAAAKLGWDWYHAVFP